MRQRGCRPLLQINVATGSENAASRPHVRPAAARYLACRLLTIQTMASFRGVGSECRRPASTMAPLTTSISVCRFGFHILQHGGARADRLLEQAGDRLPPLRVIEVDPLRLRNRHDLGEQPLHERDRPSVLDQFVRREMEQRRRRQRAYVQRELLPYLVDDARRRRRLDAGLAKCRDRRVKARGLGAVQLPTCVIPIPECLTRPGPSSVPE